MFQCWKTWKTLEANILTENYKLGISRDVLFVEATLVDPSHFKSDTVNKQLKQTIFLLYSTKFRVS